MPQPLTSPWIQKEAITSEELPSSRSVEIAKAMEIIKGFPSAYTEPTKKDPGRHAHAIEKIHVKPHASGAGKNALQP